MAAKAEHRLQKKLTKFAGTVLPRKKPCFPLEKAQEATGVGKSKSNPSVTTRTQNSKCFLPFDELNSLARDELPKCLGNCWKKVFCEWSQSLWWKFIVDKLLKTMLLKLKTQWCVYRCVAVLSTVAFLVLVGLLFSKSNTLKLRYFQWHFPNKVPCLCLSSSEWDNVPLCAISYRWVSFNPNTNN